MDIAYAGRSRFMSTCEDAIRQKHGQLAEGRVVHVVFEGGGYAGRVVVTIPSGASDCFESDWEGADPARFPARIKAAVTALRNCECFGRYQIIHQDGSLDIRVA